MNTIIKIVKEFLWLMALAPFIPFLVVLMFYYGWILGIARRMPEDLDEQVRCANAQIGEKRYK